MIKRYNSTYTHILIIISHVFTPFLFNFLVSTYHIFISTSTCTNNNNNIDINNNNNNNLPLTIQKFDNHDCYPLPVQLSPLYHRHGVQATPQFVFNCHLLNALVSQQGMHPFLLPLMQGNILPTPPHRVEWMVCEGQGFRV